MKDVPNSVSDFLKDMDAAATARQAQNADEIPVPGSDSLIMVDADKAQREFVKQARATYRAVHAAVSKIVDDLGKDIEIARHTHKSEVDAISSHHLQGVLVGQSKMLAQSLKAYCAGVAGPSSNAQGAGMQAIATIVADLTDALAEGVEYAKKRGY